MSEPLEELRAQRALIQQHLDWLDARIAATEGSDSEAQSQSKELDEKPMAAHPAPAASAATKDTKESPISPEPATKAAVSMPASPTPAVTMAQAQAAKPTASIAELATPLFDIDEAAQISTTSDIRKAQIGCLVIFAIAILGFLFLLFGLPYLVD